MMDHDQAAPGPSPAWRQGWAAAAGGSLTPNPFGSAPAEFSAWFAGYFAHQEQHYTSRPPRPQPEPKPGSKPEPEGLASADIAEEAVIEAADPDGGMPDAASAADPRPATTITFVSPGFAARRPELRNAALIPPHIRGAMEVSWSVSAFEERDITVTMLEDAWVAHEGLVFDRDLALLPGTSVAFSDEDVFAARAAIEAARSTGQVWHHAGRHVLAKKRAPNNYGHFLMECFPRAAIGDGLIAGGATSAIVHRCKGRIMDVAYTALSRVGIDLDRIELTGNEPHQFEALIVIDGLTKHGSYMSPMVLEQVGRLAAGIAPGPHKKLYVTRQSVPTRALVNEAELAQRLSDAGYVAIDPGEMTLDEQIAAFAGAERVVGVLGAALTNVAFCQPGTQLAVIAPASMPDTFFWFIAQHRRHDYLEVRCAELPGDADPTWNRPIAIEPADIGFLASW